jgi:hypothetical protein
MAILTKILSWLPFDGSKTKLGILLAIITFAQGFLGDQASTIAGILSDKPINWIALLTVAIGLLHKWLKANHPTS